MASDVNQNGVSLSSNGGLVEVKVEFIPMDENEEADEHCVEVDIDPSKLMNSELQIADEDGKVEFINLNPPKDPSRFEDESVNHSLVEAVTNWQSSIEPLHFLDAKSPADTDGASNSKKKKRKKESTNPQDLYECPICQEMIGGRTSLNKHIKRHTKEGYLECAHCGKKFETRNNLKHHIRIHTGEKPYKCDKCSKSFVQLGHLQSHLLSHTEERPFTCWMCGKGFKVKKSLRLHMDVHSEKKRLRSNVLLRCPICNMIFKTKASFNRHQSLNHSSSNNNLTKKIMTNSNNSNKETLQRTTFKCSYCLGFFTDRYLLKQHEETHIDAYRCEICNKPFEDLINLKRHEHNHKELRFTDDLRCIICDVEFDNRNDLISHMSTHDEMRPHECHVCNKRFKAVTNLRRHQIIHTDFKPFTCEICDKSFNVKDNLERHKQTHKSEKSHAVATLDGRYLCSDCPSQFNGLSQLIHHRRSHKTRDHRGLNPTFKCPKCRNMYWEASSLQKHLARHNDSKKSIKCSVCDKSFSQSNNLKAHMRVHTGEKPYTCPICTQRFRFHSGFTQHFKTHRVMAFGEVVTPDTNNDAIFSEGSSFLDNFQPISEQSTDGSPRNDMLEDIKPVIINDLYLSNLENSVSMSSNSANSENLETDVELGNNNGLLNLPSVSLSLPVR